jgi:hypothetical protein
LRDHFILPEKEQIWNEKRVAGSELMRKIFTDGFPTGKTLWVESRGQFVCDLREDRGTPSETGFQIWIGKRKAHGVYEQACLCSVLHMYLLVTGQHPMWWNKQKLDSQDKQVNRGLSQNMKDAFQRMQNVSTYSKT